MKNILATPYYLIDERRLLKNLKIIKRVRECSGAKIVLALKCFSTWSVFNLMRKYLDGTTASSVYEARLGHQKFGKETQVYSPGFSLDDIKNLSKFIDKIIFNSISQLEKFYPYCRNLKIGLRVNPEVSYSKFDLADPARKYSRLGIINKNSLLKALGLISGVMFHFNCENDNFKNFSDNIDYISKKYNKLLKRLEWVSLGGGIYFTKDDYPLEKFCKKLNDFGRRFNAQVYLEPGESIITCTGELVTKVLDIVHNKIDIAIVDASIEAHMLDLLVYRTPAKINNSSKGNFTYMIAGRSCLAGDVFGSYRFKSRLKIGSIIRFFDAAGYTIVKKNWFNGLNIPSIVIKRLNNKVELVRKFGYNDFVRTLS